MAEPAKRSRKKARHDLDGVRLTGDRIVVRHPDEGERTSRGGLLIPATAQPAPKRCVWSEAVLVGPEVRGVRVGDAVLFLPQSGLEIELEGEDFLLLRERDVQAVTAAPEAADRQPGQYL
jgi:chaperonin GroES